MIRALRTAASGMYAQELQLDNTAINLANTSTTGYKKSRINFQDLYYDRIVSPSTLGRESTSAGVIEIGYGSQVAGTHRVFAQGSLIETQNSTDLAIVGDGMFKVLLADGSYGYTRDGALSLSADGMLVNSGGFALEPQIVVPEEAESIAITQDGNVWAYISDSTDPEMLGQITLTRFLNPSGLKAMGENIFVATDSSGEPLEDYPGSEGLGYVKQGFLEGSNVSAVEEMVSLMTSQRAYEINSKAIKAADEILGTVANLSR